MQKIDDFDEAIIAFHGEWQLNRDMIEGERAVKPRRGMNGQYVGGSNYLPREAGLDDAQLGNITLRTPFFPGAARTHEGIVGLIFRKPATVEAPESVKDILETITSDGYTLDDLAEEVTSEFLITNFVGLVIDYPIAPVGISKAAAIASGFRPFVAMYRATSILGIETGVINNRLRVVRVRLFDDDNVIRELRLDDGVYTVTLWRRERNGGQWQSEAPITPMMNGKTIDEIPFTLVTSSRKFVPTKAKMHDVCRINAQHFIAASNLAQCDYWVSHPTPYLFGPKGTQNLSLAPGTFLGGELDGSKVRIGMLEYSGTAIAELGKRVQSLADDMAKVGSRILAAEKTAVEAAESLAIKTASENAALASTARLVSRKVNDALKWVSWWLGLDEGSIRYEANTDFGTNNFDEAAITSRMAMWQSGLISKDALLDLFISAEVLPETFDKEADAELVAQEVVDRPPTDAEPFDLK